MKIAVMGTGGVGGYFGGRLDAHGEDVTFVARGAHLQAIRERGLRVKSLKGDFEVPNAKATDNPSSIGAVDVVLFCVKAWDTRDAARAISPIVREGSAVISLQNGVENEDVIAEVLGSGPTVGGLAYITSTITEPGCIEHSSSAARLIFGELDGHRSPRLKAFLDACLGAGIEAELTDDIAKAMWTKLLYIAAFAGICTVTRQPLGPVLGDVDTRQLFVASMEEVRAVATAKGVALDGDIVERQLALADTFGAGLKPSMLADLERGNRLEVEWLNGAVARIGASLGVDTPVNRFIYAALKLLA